MKGGSRKEMPENVSDLEVEALVDSQLDEDRQLQVWQDISLNPGLYDRYARLTAQKEWLQRWWKQESDETRQMFMNGQAPEIYEPATYEPEPSPQDGPGRKYRH